MPNGWTKYVLSFAVGALSMLLAAYVMASGLSARVVALEIAAANRDRTIVELREDMKNMPDTARKDPFTGADAELMEEKLRHECESRVEALRRELEREIRQMETRQ